MATATSGFVGAALLTAGTVILASIGAAHAAGTDAQKCAAAKLSTVGKYAACRLKADTKAETSGETPDYAKCDAKQVGDWAKIETKYGAECHTSGDQSTLQSDITAMTACLAGNLSTTGTPTAVALECVPCPAGGAIVDGTCWIISAPGDSCTAACALEGMAYDDKTDTYASVNSGTIGHCAFILDELGVGDPWSGIQPGQGPPNCGCSAYGAGQRFSTAAPITAQASYPVVQRACACH